MSSAHQVKWFGRKHCHIATSNCLSFLVAEKLYYFAEITSVGCAFAFKEANNGVYCQAMLDYITNNIFPRYNTRWKKRTSYEKKGWFWQKEEKVIWLRACLEGLSFCGLQQSNFTGSEQLVKTFCFNDIRRWIGMLLKQKHTWCKIEITWSFQWRWL